MKAKTRRLSVIVILALSCFLLGGCRHSGGSQRTDPKDVLSLDYWTMDLQTLEQTLTSSGWERYEDALSQSPRYLGTYQNLPAYIRFTIDPDTGLVNSVLIESRFYPQGSEASILAIKEGLEVDEWSPTRAYSPYEGAVADQMAAWLLQARHAMVLAGGTLGEHAARLTGETVADIAAVLRQYLDDSTIKTFQIGERWFIFDDGSLGGICVQTVQNPEGSLHFYACMELYCPGYEESTGFRPDAEGYSMSPDDTPFLIGR